MYHHLHCLVRFLHNPIRQFGGADADVPAEDIAPLHRSRPLRERSRRLQDRSWTILPYAYR